MKSPCVSQFAEYRDFSVFHGQGEGSGVTLMVKNGQEACPFMVRRMIISESCK